MLIGVTQWTVCRVLLFCPHIFFQVCAMNFFHISYAIAINTRHIQLLYFKCRCTVCISRADSINHYRVMFPWTNVLVYVSVCPYTIFQACAANLFQMSCAIWIKLDLCKLLEAYIRQIFFQIDTNISHLCLRTQWFKFVNSSFLCCLNYDLVTFTVTKHYRVFSHICNNGLVWACSTYYEQTKILVIRLVNGRQTVGRAGRLGWSLFCNFWNLHFSPSNCVLLCKKHIWPNINSIEQYLEVAQWLWNFG